MKLIIDIPTEHYSEIVFQDVDKLRECVKNGTVVENVTGGDYVNRLDVLAILLKAYNESRFDGYSDYCAVSDLVADLPSIKIGG